MANILKVKNGNTWVNIPSIVGAKGQKGDKGDKGDTGDVGYIFFDIINGELVYTREELSDIDFEIINGNLCIINESELVT